MKHSPTLLPREAAAPAARTGRARPLRVCTVAYTFYESDGRVMRYNEALAARGDHIEVLALRKPGKPRESAVKGVRITAIQKREVNERSQLAYMLRILLFFLRATAVLTWRQLHARYDLVHVHSVPDFLIFTAWLPKLMGARVILDIHDLLPELYASKFGVGEDSPIFRTMLLLERASTAFANHVITANDIWHAKLLGRSVRPGNATALVNYPDRSIFSRRGRTRSDGRFVMIYPGTLNHHQGLDLAIEAFHRVRDRLPEAEFHIYGAGPALPSLKSQARSLGLEDRVFFKGTVPLREVPRLMENADLGVVPKRKDSFGNEAFSTKTLEFMALGVPVLVSDTLIDTHYFDGSVVKFFRGGSVDDLAAAMVELASNRRFRDSLAENGLRYVQSECWDVKKEIYLNLVDSLAALPRDNSDTPG